MREWRCHTVSPTPYKIRSLQLEPMIIILMVLPTHKKHAQKKTHTPTIEKLECLREREEKLQLKSTQNITKTSTIERGRAAACQYFRTDTL